MNITNAFYKIIKLANHQHSIDIAKMLSEPQYRMQTLSEAANSSNQELAAFANQLLMIPGINSGKLNPDASIDFEQNMLIGQNRGIAASKPKAAAFPIDADNQEPKTSGTKSWLIGGISVCVVALLAVLIYSGVNRIKQQEQAPSVVASKPTPAPTRAVKTQSPSGAIAPVTPIAAPVKTDYKLAFRIHGSNTVGEKLAPMLLENFYLSKQAQTITLAKTDVAVENNLQVSFKDGGAPIKVELHAHGSSTGFKALMAGTTDMSMSSRRIKDKEVAALEPKFGKLDQIGSEHIIGLDGLAVIVHKSNPISKLTTQQIAQLFSGTVKDWSELGGKPGPVTIYALDNNSGTWDSFKSMVLKKHQVKLAASANRYESSSELSNNVSQDPQAIGFIGLPYILNAKVLAVSDEANTLAFFPTPFTVATEDYPLSRRLYMYTPSTNASSEIQTFMDYVMSSKGQEIVKQAGFISQNLFTVKPAPDSSFPEEYLAMLNQADRLSLSLRFISGKFELDNKGQRDLTRIVEFLNQNSNKQLLLAGFTDNFGDPQQNQSLSVQRAHAVSKLLESYGIVAKSVTGFGEAAPIASNDSPYGRYKNRRVEAWVM